MYSSWGNLFIIWDLINSTIRSITEHANDLDCAFVASHEDWGFLCRMGARCSLTLNTKLGSFINALAYWSSVMQISIRKLNFTVWCEESDLVSCMTIEQYSRNVTRRLLGLVWIKSFGIISVVMSVEGSTIANVAEEVFPGIEFTDVAVASVADELYCVSTLEANGISLVSFDAWDDWLGCIGATKEDDSVW